MSMKTAVSIPDKIFHSAERAKKRLGLSRSALYQQALEAYLSVHDDRAITDALDRIYASRGKESDLDPVLERLQRSSVSGEDW